MATVNLSWVEPTQFTNGEAIEAGQITEYRIERENAEGPNSNIMQVPAGTTSATLTGEPEGENTYVVYASESDGDSGRMAEVTLTVQDVVPQAVTNLQAQNVND